MSDGLIDTANPEHQTLPGRSIFLAHAFTRLLTDEGTVDLTSKQRLVGMMDRFRGAGYAVHCALEREGWGARLMSPGTAIQLDYSQVQKAGYLVSFPQGSPGAFMELGFRLAPPKPTVLVWSQSLVNQDPAANQEERDYMKGMLGVLEDNNVPHLLIEDPTADGRAFEAEIPNQILGWIAQQAPPGH